MQTEPTTTIAVRVPISIRQALEADAADFNRSPGEHLRELLVGRYAARRGARNSHADAHDVDDGKVALNG